MKGARGVLVLCTVLTFGCSRCDRTENQEQTPVKTLGPEGLQLPRPAAVSASVEPKAAPVNPPSPDLEAESDADLEPSSLEEQRRVLFERLRRRLALTDPEIVQLEAVFGRSKHLGQGNPQLTRHPMTRAECRRVREASGELPEGDPRCGKPNMVPLYHPGAGQTQEDSKVCIDQYEFPNLACEYPVVYARANEVVELCRALGKRICDAHEWEGACAGALRAPELEYRFGHTRLMMEYLHNKEREIVWAYGPAKDHALCATGSKKSPKCQAGGFRWCGSNTYPAGAFPACRSPLGVFDLHGNAAEHMNLPIRPEELASRGGLGETEMKGSWFIFSSTEAHQDDCRWRAPMWHHTRVGDENSHANYHLGFRCCRDL